MTQSTLSGYQDGFLEIVEEQLKLCQQEVRDLDQQIERKHQEIADLRAERGLAAKRAQQLEDVLGGQEPDNDQQAAPVPSPTPSKPLADADAVVELIQERGAMHYLDIHRTLVARGFEIGGEGKADTLLSRYFNDPRLNRVARGTYDIVDKRSDPSKHVSQSDREESIRLPVQENRHSPPPLRTTRTLPYSNIEGKDTFELSYGRLKARAVFLGNKRMKVLCGSQASKDTNELGVGGAKSHRLRKEMTHDGSFEDRGSYYELTRDTSFDTPSSAATVMSGSSKNGWTEWKTVDGRTLDDVHRK